jgi:hypothetical protein
VICANRIPDQATIARFRVRHEQALAATFTQVLVLSARAGLVSVGMVALDGSPISGNASPGATRTYATIREEVDAILEQAAETDAAEDEQFRWARGDELPAPLADRRSRLERLRRCREELEREEAEAQAEYAAKLAWRADWEAEHGRKLTGRKPTPPDAEALVKRKPNTTDPDTRMTPQGQARYRRRQQIVEPVFANIKYLRRVDRFQRRGLRACQAEWKLITATHNLLKLWRATRIPAAA